MFKAVFRRSWLTPLLAVCFVALAGSGVLMMFRAYRHALEDMHEWLGLAVVLIGALHAALNWPALFKCFRSRTGLIAATVGLLAVAVLTWSPWQEPRGARECGRHGTKRAHEHRSESERD